MASEAHFSWRKIISFFGVAILAFLGFVGISQGLGLIIASRVIGGILTIVAGACAFVVAFLLYKSYEKYSKEHNNQKPNYTR